MFGGIRTGETADRTQQRFALLLYSFWALWWRSRVADDLSSGQLWGVVKFVNIIMCTGMSSAHHLITIILVIREGSG